MRQQKRVTGFRQAALRIDGDGGILSIQKYFSAIYYFSQKKAEWLYPLADSIVSGIFHISLDILEMYYKAKVVILWFITQGDSYAMCNLYSLLY